MGTEDPLVHIEAATLAGGDNNQDRYAYGDGWAFVLDGASSFSETPPVHDGGWYAERLKNALAAQLESASDLETTGIVAQAIYEASAAHDARTQGPCPTSTIALARWDVRGMEVYVLGDSYAAIVAPSGKVGTLLADSRIDQFGAAYRSVYQSRLRGGHGFDREHRRLLSELQAAQSAARNRHEGYWIAGDNPVAARYGKKAQCYSSCASIFLFTDGLTTICSAEDTCKNLIAQLDLDEYLGKLHAFEYEDGHAREYPRAKPHDDKTLINIRLTRV